MPGVPVALASDRPLGPEDVFVQREDVDVGARLAKLAVYGAAPAEWDYVLYLDADTELAAPVDFLFEQLRAGWEALICKDMNKYAVVREMKRPDNKDEFQVTVDMLGSEELMQYNGGVFAFRRNARVEKFFKLWNQEWQRYGKRDQGALLRALHQHPIRLYILPNLWNASTRYPIPPGQVVILHHNMEARRWGGLIWGRTDSDEAWEAVKKWQREHGGLSPKEVGH
jgi:hypothetical protein